MSSKKKWLAGSVVLNAVLICGLVFFFSVSGASGGRVVDSKKAASEAEQKVPSAHRKKHSLTALGDFQVALLIDKKGKMVPVLKDGTRLEPCGKEGGTSNNCRIFKEKVQLGSVDTMSFLSYKINPYCYFYVINGVLYEYCI